MEVDEAVREPELAGYLATRHGLSDDWNTLFFRLKKNMLFCYRTSQDDTPLEYHDVSQCVVDKSINSEKDHQVFIKVSSAISMVGDTHFILTTTNDADNSRWFSALCNSSHKISSPSFPSFSSPSSPSFSPTSSYISLPTSDSTRSLPSSPDNSCRTSTWTRPSKAKNISQRSATLGRDSFKKNSFAVSSTPLLGTTKPPRISVVRSPPDFTFSDSFDFLCTTLPPLPPIPHYQQPFTSNPTTIPCSSTSGSLLMVRSLSQQEQLEQQDEKETIDFEKDDKSEKTDDGSDYHDHDDDDDTNLHLLTKNVILEDLEEEGEDDDDKIATTTTTTTTTGSDVEIENLISLALPEESPDTDVEHEDHPPPARRILVNEEKIMKRLSVEIPTLQKSNSKSLLLLNTIMDEIEEETGRQSLWHNVVKQHYSAQTDRRLSHSGRHRVISTPHTQEQKQSQIAKMNKLYKTYVAEGNPHENYVINSRSIAKGSLGEVFFATTTDKNEQVAIKKLQLLRNGRDRLPFILREIDIIATSAHKNIVKYIESFKINSELWVVMEYMSAGSLYEIVKLYPRGIKLKESGCAYIMYEVLEAVAFLHARKRIHRDIKVDNILLSKNGCVKLADFGTAVQLTFQRLWRNTIAGTPYYMAPELISRSDYGEKVDIWSVGISVVELMAGTPPINTLDPMKALEVITTKGIVGLKPKKYSEDICHFVNERCLQVDPLVRASAAELLQHPWLESRISQEEFAKIVNAMRLNTDLTEIVGLSGTEGENMDGSGCTIL